MDPCSFLRIVVGGLALKIDSNSVQTNSKTHFYCKIKLNSFPTQSSSIPLITNKEDDQIPNIPISCFNLNKPQLEKLAPKSPNNRKPSCLRVEIYSGLRGVFCGFGSGKLLGTVLVPLDLKTGENRAQVLRSGWVGVGAKGSLTQLHLNVKAEPDPRFVFRFDGEPECSPQVFQVNGSLRQPVFTCKFGFRSDPNLRSRSSSTEESTSKKSWLNSFKGITREQSINERKGWSITIHDLSGSPVATASMVTPFVPSPGTDRVSKSSPGAWLILRPGDGTWKPWGRLEAWLEPSSCLGYRFDLLPDAVSGGGASPITLAASTLRAGGRKFVIDINNFCCPLLPLPSSSSQASKRPLMALPSSSSQASSRSSSCDFSSSGSGSSGSWEDFAYRGFVMSSTVGGGRPEVEVGVDHVGCAEDAAAFVALAAALELSVDACRPFDRKIRKELRRNQSGEFVL